ncbi:hypothetical protein [Actinomadura atramentaria]|uniref:hypothetical protein n=1 Tax=Actinomadura atramentaria TaxID=1990 RepID=UPI00036D3F2A|nr:hypothetical protein [Actinomadura atramentaria]
MRINDLSPQQQKLYTAVVELEAEGRPGFVQDVAARAGMDADAARPILRTLLDGAELVHEVPSDPDMGPEYRTQQRG